MHVCAEEFLKPNAVCWSKYYKMSIHENTFSARGTFWQALVLQRTSVRFGQWPIFTAIRPWKQVISSSKHVFEGKNGQNHDKRVESQYTSSISLIYLCQGNSQIKHGQVALSITTRVLFDSDGIGKSSRLKCGFLYFKNNH